jgi:hypothetical protein
MVSLRPDQKDFASGMRYIENCVGILDERVPPEIQRFENLRSRKPKWLDANFTDRGKQDC